MELVSPIYVKIIAILAMILGLALAGWWVVAIHWVHSREVEDRLPHIKLPSDLREVITGSPPALTIFYVFVILTMIAYVIYTWLGGVSY